MRYTFFLLLFTLNLASEPIAIVTKVRGKTLLTGTKNKLKVNSPIYLEDEILVSSKSFLKCIFLDDGSSLNVYPETSLQITGSIADRKIQKEITLNYGSIQTQINPQLNGEFKLLTKNSELTCEECAFWALTMEGIEDKFYKINNSATVYNPSVEFYLEIPSDSTLFSIQGKDPYLKETSVSEQKHFELLLLDAEESLTKIEQTLEMADSDSVSTPLENILRIKLKNAANEERELILTYTRE